MNFSVWPTAIRPTAALCAALAALAVRVAAGDAGRDWGVLGSEYLDPATGVRVRELTHDGGDADNLYFHFSNFTADNRHVLFTWQPPGTAQTHLFWAEAATGRVRQLTDDTRISAGSACPDPLDADRIYLARGQENCVLHPGTLAVKVVASLPQPSASGPASLTLSADGTWLSLGRQIDSENWEIGRIDTRTGRYRPVIRQGFRIGHVQHHPTLPLIFYVWETGGFAPQRTWRNRVTVALIDLRALPAVTLDTHPAPESN